MAALVDFMLEDITGQIENGTEEAPSEFVSVGVGDDHGSNVDGVKYFPTENGNTVTSNVVTEATGATIAIPDPNQGVQIWEARTNYQLNNEDITSASYGVGVMTAEVDPTQFVTGKSIDWTFLEALGSAYHFVTLAASEDTGEFSAEGRRSFFVRARGRTYITLYDFGALECSFFIGVGQGTKDTNVAFTLDANITDYGNDIFRIDFEVITPPSGNSKMRSVDVYLSNSPGEPYGVGGNAYAGDDELGIELAGSMAELGAFVSPYIPTAGAAATRNADDLQYDPANYVETGFALLDFFVTADQLANHATSPTIFTIAKTAFGDYVTAYINDATTVTIDFVTAAGGGASTADFTVAAGNQYKIAFTWDKVTGTIRASLDGAAAFGFTGAAAVDILATADADTFEIGMYNATQFFNGNILAVQFGNSLMEDADLEALST